jgi:nitrate/nitrite transport system permease protein
MTPNIAINASAIGPTAAAPISTSSMTSNQATTTTTSVPTKPPAPVVSEAVKKRVRRERILKIVAPLLGILLAILIWEIISKTGKTIPGPLITWNAAVTAFANPFYVNGPNDQGIGFKIVNSLARVGLGFGLAALVGIPLGFMIGPVSPLAWLPIGLLVFQGAQPAAIWTIFISSIWPMIINTAVGVQKIPQDYMNVAKVLNLSEWRILTNILIPATLPYVLTGVRLAIGVAWLVIVAAEMLTGGVGIGFWVWDEWNNLKVENILLAIVIIGIIGMMLEWSLLWIAKRFSYGQ